MRSLGAAVSYLVLALVVGAGATMFVLDHDETGESVPPATTPLPPAAQQPAQTPGPNPLVAKPAPDVSPEQTAMIAPPKPALSSVAPLQAGLAALSGKRLDQARLARDGLPASSLDRHILSWAIALHGGPTVPSADIAWAVQNLPGWPANQTLRRNGERAAYRESAGDEVVRGFAGTEPQTLEGGIVLARAHLSRGDGQAARTVLAPMWRTAKPELREEMVVISEFGAVLGKDDHRARMEMMLYEERPQSALRIAKLAGAEELAKAWTAVLARAPDAGKLLETVPESQRGAGYLFAKARYFRQKNRTAGAAAILLKAPSDSTALVSPDSWWSERRLVARRLLDAKKAETAYKLAAGHTAKSPGEAADAEFHAGWIALRFLKRPQEASKHFARIAELGEGAITLSRAYYWLGRATEAGAAGNAAEHYATAARYGTTFYGQLAALKTGAKALGVAAPVATDADREQFDRREAVQAIDRLAQAGYPHYAARLYTELAQQLTSAGELALLADKAEAANNHFVALRVGKIAAQRGIDVGALTHPVGAIPDTAQISGAGKALAYAIARQESEFNVGAVSGAGALGLLQLMPGTAQEMAKKVGLEYSAPRLTSDAAYNATLGAEMLNQQLNRFSGSYVLTFAGYNAGPRRADQWVKRYGDPRGKSVEEVVDWIERVPFSETRSYIQRVLENYEVYKMQLSGSFDLARDLTTGRAAAVR